MTKLKDKMVAHHEAELEKFYKAFAKEYLKYLGNANPSFKQLTEVQFLLSKVWVQRAICLDNRLTHRERQTLYLSAFGRSIKEIAVLLGISIRQVERHRSLIFQKLNTKNIAESVTQGLCFGEIKASDEPSDLK